MSVYVTISCNTCKSDVGYGNAVASVTVRDGIENHTHHSYNCGCSDLLKPCNKIYNFDENKISKCRVCGSADLHEHFDSDE